jgi:hypothetical protein
MYRPGKIAGESVFFSKLDSLLSIVKRTTIICLVISILVSYFKFNLNEISTKDIIENFTRPNYNNEYLKVEFKRVFFSYTLPIFVVSYVVFLYI